MTAAETQEEILNIDYHVKFLVLKALNKFPGNMQKAAKALGQSKRNVFRLMGRYQILRKGIGKKSVFFFKKDRPLTVKVIHYVE